MGSNSLLFKCFITFLIYFPCFLCVICQNCGRSCRGAQSPTSPPGQLIFDDQRIAVVYQVIQDFKKTITDDPQGITKTWVGPGICNYTGFYCDRPPDNVSAIAVASIDFNGYNLTAPTLVGFIDRFPDLALFHANSNNFAGTIPSNISKLQYFYELDISNNDFFGEFPPAVLGLNDLAFLDIRFNSFSGTVPAQIFAETGLEVLFINNNKFIQPLPDNLGNTPVSYLTFANNRFTGPIPPSIGNASATLFEVLFLNNKLSGCLPYEIGLLKEATVFDAGNNLLTGPLPFSLSCLEKIEQLNFAGNLLYGQVPEVVCELGSLLNLSLSDNYFTLIGPTCKKLVDSGVLDLRKNCIPGLPEQRSATDCWWFATYYSHWHCQYSWWFTTYIPCKAPSHAVVHGHPPRPKGSKRKLLSYAALSEHGL